MTRTNYFNSFCIIIIIIIIITVIVVVIIIIMVIIIVTSEGVRTSLHTFSFTPGKLDTFSHNKSKKKMHLKQLYTHSILWSLVTVRKFREKLIHLFLFKILHICYR